MSRYRRKGDCSRCLREFVTVSAARFHGTEVLFQPRISSTFVTVGAVWFHCAEVLIRAVVHPPCGTAYTDAAHTSDTCCKVPFIDRVVDAGRDAKTTACDSDGAVKPLVLTGFCV